MKIKSVYVIGSLRNPNIPKFGNMLEKAGFEAFTDWFSPGPRADDHLRDYAKKRGLNYKQTLQTYAARQIFEFDKKHIDRCDAAVVLMPAGKSACLELGYVRGIGKPGFILFNKEPKRVDVMFQFASDIFFNQKDLIQALKSHK